MKFLIATLLLFSSLSAMAAQELTNAAEVKAAFAKGRPLVIMFYTTWCPACKSAKPKYLQAEKALAGKVDFYFMDTDKLGLKSGPHSNLSIEAIPTFSAGKTEQEVRSGANLQVGIDTTEDLINYVKGATGQ